MKLEVREVEVKNLLKHFLDTAHWANNAAYFLINEDNKQMENSIEDIEDGLNKIKELHSKLFK